MTRRERHTQFSDGLQKWLRENVGPLMLCEVVGIMQCQMTEMILDANFEEVDGDDGGEGWKAG